jgi:hypothetical protein
LIENHFKCVIQISTKSIKSINYKKKFKIIKMISDFLKLRNQTLNC